jgi:predicted membrane-bound mannosyltransferase
MRRWAGRKRFGFNLRRTALFILIGLLLIAILWYISQLAGLGVDGYAHWGIKAKASFLDGGWILSREGMRRFSHPVYPLLVPSQQGWIYTFLGQVDEQAVKIVFVMFYLALGALFYHAVRPFYDKILTVFFTLLMMSTPLLALSALAAYADIPLMFFLFGSVFFLIKWLDQGRIRDMVIGAVLAAFLLLVKREGTIYWLVLLIFLSGSICSLDEKGSDLYQLAILLCFRSWQF